VVESSSERITICGVELWEEWRWFENVDIDWEIKLQRWQRIRGGCGCSAQSDWLIPESMDMSAEVLDVAGESAISLAAVHWRIEKKSPHRSMATRIADRDVDFLAVGFFGASATPRLSESSGAEHGRVAVVEVEGGRDSDGAESSPQTLPIVVSSHLGALPPCLINECCLSCNLSPDTHKVTT